MTPDGGIYNKKRNCGMGRWYNNKVETRKPNDETALGKKMRLRKGKKTVVSFLGEKHSGRSNEELPKKNLQKNGFKSENTKKTHNTTAGCWCPFHHSL